MTVIGYDEAVKDLISGLNATGHITHGNYRKTMVTWHHNGGILTAEQVLDVWKTRAASAHFDVDAHGSIAQYAAIHDYAWSCTNTLGNQVSISIEMCNQTLAPKWLVSDTTWKSAARLTAWLFAFEIHARPSRQNIVFHHYWYATSCAGPYMDSIYNKALKLCQTYYDGFMQGKTPPNVPKPRPITVPANLVIDGVMGTNSTNALEYLAGLRVFDGEISGQATTIRLGTDMGATLDACWPTIAYGDGGSQSIGYLQHMIGVSADGEFGPATRQKLQNFLNVKVDGIPGFVTVKALQKWINTQLVKARK